MTKVCTHGRDAALATQMLEQTLRRLQTDHLDLWQIHGVGFENDPDLFIRPGGAAEALNKAKKDGKVRFVGFTGHKDPDVHLAMLNTGFPFDAVQMPLNPFDANFSSFEQNVLPALNQRGIAALAMKPIGGHGEPVQKGSSPLPNFFAIRCPCRRTTIAPTSLRSEARSLRLHAKANAARGRFGDGTFRSSSTTRRRRWLTSFTSMCSRSNGIRGRCQEKFGATYRKFRQFAQHIKDLE